MAVGTKKNNIVSGVALACVHSAHLQHYRLAKPAVQPTDLTSVATFFYEPQANGTLPYRKSLPLLTSNRILPSFASVNRDVPHPGAYGSPRHIDLACDASVSVARLAQLDRSRVLQFSTFIGAAHPHPCSYEIPASMVLCLCRLGYAPGTSGSIPVRFAGPARCNNRPRGMASPGVRGSTRPRGWGWHRPGGAR